MNGRGRHDMTDLTAMAAHPRRAPGRLCGTPVIESVQRESPVQALLVQGRREAA
jgi:hypothetical protein